MLGSLRIVIIGMFLATSFQAQAQLRLPKGAELDDYITPDELYEDAVNSGSLDPNAAPVIKVGPAKVKVWVDKDTQEIYIMAPGIEKGDMIVQSNFGDPEKGEFKFGDKAYDIKDRLVRLATGEIAYRAKISSGGTLKRPSNLWKNIHCASTPDFRGFIPTGRMDAKKTSGTYLNSEGERYPMPWAVNVVGGIFLHQAMPGSYPNLGKAVSGGCVRQDQMTSEVLFHLMKRHGGIDLKISGKAPAANGESCNIPPEDVAHRAKLRQQCAAQGRTGICYEKDLRRAPVDSSAPIMKR